MRIALVCPYNYFRPGGVQFCIRDLANQLQENGHYVRIIAPRSRNIPKKIPDNIILLGGSTELNTPFHTKADINIARDIEAIDKVFAREKFDILHFHEPGIPILASQLLSRSTAKNVGTMHASLPEGMLSKSFEKIMTPFAKYIEPKLDAVTAVSEVAKNISLGYAPNLDIEIVPNGIVISDYVSPNKVLQNKKKQKVILYVGRLERRKGVQYLVDAYDLLRKSHNNVQLIIAGEGKHRSRLEARVAKNKTPDVSFLGFITEKEKQTLMQSADIYCSPALYGESFGIVLLEAMAAGTVVVAGNNPGYACVMTDRGRLSLVDPQDTISFAQRLELLLYDDQIRALWLEWSKDYVKKYDFKNVTKAYEKVYRRVLNKK